MLELWEMYIRLTIFYSISILFAVKITVFYILFFAGLAAFFGLMLWIFLQTLDPAHPKWIGKNGLIGGNPGIGFR